jgi:endonuclease IV
LTRKTDESEKIAKILGITQADVIKRRKIILENAAGEGRKLCSTLEEINEVIQGVDKKLRGQVSVCIDSQHAYARGLFDWGLKGEIDKFYKEFDKIIGLKYLEVLHFNDSMESDKKASNAPFGGRKDRHQQLSEGYIFGTDERMECIVEFMLKAREHKIITIGEPPVSGMDDWILVCSLLEDTEYPLMKVITAS